MPVGRVLGQRSNGERGILDRSLRSVTDSLDVVAARIAYEGAVVLRRVSE